MAKKLEMAKVGAEILVSIGVSVIVGGAIVMVKPPKLGTIKKIATCVGGYALASMVADRTVAYVDEKITETIKQVKNIFTVETKDSEENN